MRAYVYIYIVTSDAKINLIYVVGIHDNNII